MDRKRGVGEALLADLGVGVHCVHDAVAEVLVDEAERDLLQRGVDGRDLGEDVDAVGVVFLALDTELSALGAAIGANDRTNIERHMTATAVLAAPSILLTGRVTLARSDRALAASEVA